MLKKLVGKASAAAGGMAASASAFAAAQDYSSVTTAITTEITAAMPIVLGVGGVLLGIGVAFRLIRRAGKF